MLKRALLLVLPVVAATAGNLETTAHADGTPTVQAAVDIAKERAKLCDFLADKHAELGETYKKALLNREARRQFDRARDLVADHDKAMRGLGFKKKKDQWVEDQPLPEQDGLKPAEVIEARKKPDEERTKVYEKCADRSRKAMESARAEGDNSAAAILAIYLLYYAPEDAAARGLRSHRKGDAGWRPGFVLDWRAEGRKQLEAAGFGEEVEGEDEQAKAIESRFWRRSTQFLTVRTSVSEDRAKMLHRSMEATMKHSMALLAVSADPFGDARGYTLTHLQSDAEYEAMLTKVLKLEGDTLEFNKRLAGTGQRAPWGYICRAETTASADDMLGNTVAIRVLDQATEGKLGHPPWVNVGFSYFVTSQVLGTTSTVRYTIEQGGQTASKHEVIPEFTNASGTPEFLREVALRDVLKGNEVPLALLLTTETNDMTQRHAAKAFALIEFLFHQHAEKARQWLKSGAQEPGERAAALEKAFGMPAAELEKAWRAWVLANY